MYQRYLYGLLSYFSYYTGIVTSKRWKKKIEKSINKTDVDWSRMTYCFWMRHVYFLTVNNVWKNFAAVGEFGPGTSIGVGICSLLSGAQTYYGLDAFDRTDKNRNLEVFTV